MSDASSNDANKSIEPAGNVLSNAIEQLSGITDGSETLKPPKSLSDMPIDVVGLIIERSDYKEQLILRKTSKSLRELVDNQEPACKSIKVVDWGGNVYITFNNKSVVYTEFGYELFRENRIHVEKDDFKKVAFDDLAFTLKNPKLQLETFSFTSIYFEDAENSEFCGISEDMKSILESINHQLSVKACTIHMPNSCSPMLVLPHLKPGVLEKITIISDYNDYGWSDYPDAVRQVALLEQWKQAKELELKCGFMDSLTEHVTHFKRFQFHEGSIDSEKLVRFRDYILKHENVEFCSISTSLYAKNFDSIVGTPVSPNLSHFTVPESDYYLEIMIKDKLITIEKKKKK